MYSIISDSKLENEFSSRNSDEVYDTDVRGHLTIVPNAHVSLDRSLDTFKAFKNKGNSTVLSSIITKPDVVKDIKLHIPS